MIKKRLVQLLAHSKKYIYQNVFWQWLELIAQIVIVFTVAGFIQQGITSQLNIVNVWYFIVPVILCMLIKKGCDIMATKASYKASSDVKRILRENIYKKLLSLGASYREKISTAQVVQLSTEGVQQLEIYFGRYLPQLFYSLLAPITLFVVLSFISFKASITLLICVPLIPLSIVAVQKFAKKLLAKYWGIYVGLGNSFLENLQGLTTLKIYKCDDKKAEEMDEEAQHFRRITMKVLTMQLNSTSVMDIIAYGGAVVGMIVVLMQFLRGEVSIAGALCIIFLASEFFIPLRLLGSFFHIAMNGMSASDRIFALLDLEEGEKGTEEIDSKSIDIGLKDIHFSYDESREILSGINLDLKQGSFISLVGLSGSGKSTIAGLIMGRNKGYTGSLTINEKELTTIREDSIMENITLISSDEYIFKGTIEDNLLMGNPKATNSQMEEALKKVNLLDFINNQEGLKTQILEKGSNFSGGQRQRLALARAILHNTPVYIFDEATSNIDAESEDMIMKVLHQLAKDRTVLLISHRLSNVVDSDKIYMLEKGRIIEEGTHSQLMEKEGSYAKLYKSQKALENYGREAE